MNIKIHILNTSGNLSSCKNIIQKSVLTTIKKVRSRIELKNIDILIKEHERPEFLKDIDGVGGYCPSENFVQLSIDPKHKSFKKNTEKIMERSLSHELHHAMRRQAGVQIFGKTFLETMFSEGLADYFVYEITGDFPVWTTTLSKKDKERLMKRVEKRFRQKMSYKDYDDWLILGSKKLKIPRWTGYALGLELVKNYLKNNPSQSVSSVISAPVEKLLK